MNRYRRVRLSAWPVLMAFTLVTLLIFGMLGFDVLFTERAARRSTIIVENAQRAIVLLEQLRRNARRLTRTATGPAAEELHRSIEAAAREYDELATSPDERDQWLHLHVLLHRLHDGVEQPLAPSPDQLEQIERSVDRLVSLNTLEGNANVAAIRAAHRQAIWGNTVVSTIVVATVAFISIWLLRTLGRQRRLLDERLRLLTERNVDLQAFAWRAAHDLRTPMNPIRGYADLILEARGLPDDVKAMAQRIRRAVDRMAGVIDNMLALSLVGRPDPGQAASPEVVERTLEEMGAELEGVEVVTRLEAGRVACTEAVLAQILRNLIGNALKFRAHSRPLRLHIESRQSGTMVELAVEDNGTGMDGESAKHAFEPFFRGHPDRELPGHGLGLSIVDRAARSLGGSCELTSVPDQSTRVVVRLPAA